MPLLVEPGAAAPYGASLTSEGVNFAVFAAGDSPVSLVVFDTDQPLKVDLPGKTGQIRHGFIRGLTPPFSYAYQIGDQLLLDPYATFIKSPSEWQDPAPYQPMGVVPVPTDFDWEGDAPPHIPQEELIIYELHVRGFTRHASSRVSRPGTFLGVIEKIEHLKSLGINAIELMPVHEFNEKEYAKGSLCQYWGYSPVSFFSPMNRFGSTHDFKELVKQMHRAGIEVIVDVVFNHTSEGGEGRATYSFKGLAPDAYYLKDAEGKWLNYSGCGNTLNCNHPVTIALILDSLHYWVAEMHVDGFRFDLASILYRGENGEPLAWPPIVSAIAQDPLLANVKLIAEPWDAAGLYQVGDFFPESSRWSEWNGKYRDTVRRFIKGAPQTKGEFATRISGSEDLFGYAGRLPCNSVNFVTCHDGFSLRDLVSFNQKHNEANGEDNRDGTNDNESWNCGAEGETQDPAILALRMRQMKNFHLAILISQGIPMLRMGDEYGHTAQGNNNTWCQDNDLSWFLWDELEKNREFHHFYKELIRLRRNNPLLRRRSFLTDQDIQWHGKAPFEPAWDQDDRFLAFTLIDHDKRQDLYIAFNASGEKIEVKLPPGEWQRIMTTAESVGNFIESYSASIFAKVNK